MPRLSLGISDFKQLRREPSYYVDKSMLARNVIDAGQCVLIPRPRRFGKTLNLSMLRYFFEHGDDGNRSLFDGLAIADDSEAMEHQGRYPVIALTLKDVKFPTWPLAKQRFAKEIGRAYRAFAHVNDGLSKSEAAAFVRLMDEEGTDSDLADSLESLITHISHYYDQPVVVLIDEYDTPVTEARSNGYYDDMIKFMQSWLGAGLKHQDGTSIFRAVITGCLRIAKESLFSGLNNFTSYPMRRISPYEDKFGFTQDEVDQLLAAFEIPDFEVPIRQWYNGYQIGRTTIYNPWSVLMCVHGYPNEPEPHWLNTASNKLVFEEMDRGGPELKRDLEKLLNGEEVRYPIDDSIIFGEIGTNPNHIWSFLYNAGYLKAESPEPYLLSPTAKTYKLSIPNLEISTIYEKFVNRLFDPHTGCGIEEFLDCFVCSKPDDHIERTLQALVLSLVSHHDTARQPEAVFHAFVLGLLANLRSIYEIRSNAESGYGRADIMLRPKTDQYPFGYVIEFKSVKESEEIDTVLSDALEQIERKEYTTQLCDVGIAHEHLRRLAIVLQGKTIHVRSADG